MHDIESQSWARMISSIPLKVLYFKILISKCTYTESDIVVHPQLSFLVCTAVFCIILTEEKVSFSGEWVS